MNINNIQVFKIFMKAQNNFNLDINLLVSDNSRSSIYKFISKMILVIVQIMMKIVI